MAPSCNGGSMGARVVIVDPSYGSEVGHHHELNGALLGALKAAGWQPEVWADVGAPGSLVVRGVCQGSGYLDPRHWADLPGTLHLASRLRRQLQAAVAEDASAQLAPPLAWLAHGLLPFQLIALAQLLQEQPPAQVLLSLMFAPQEILGGVAGMDSQRLRNQAGLSARTAIQALAQACQRAGHGLVVGASSLQTLELYRPLLIAAGLPEGCLHPAVVGAGCEPSLADEAAKPRVLLHWGDLKPDKGCREAMAVVAALLRRPQPTPVDFDLLFHGFSGELMPEDEEALLQTGARQLGPSFCLLRHRVSSAEMQQHLAACDLALLAYDPITYAERSSGVLWCYGAARYGAGLPAAALGYGGHWLEREALALGLSWSVAPPQATAEDGDAWLAAIENCLSLQTEPAYATWTGHGQQVLGSSFARWVLGRLPKF